ncbi:MAG: hypothetical protein CO135_03350 [Candidatus Levybacteria bacterium CG_4_9_14_3_um_filter_35_16]|nr:MAG: hypothetical protein COW87_03470 [Candidatus Levybacteria bacterium CG22_combo_CG10-13_8_21_14_all_35_11]PIY95145.1 MAG: hypothetical protein COY68_00185 [Candidatus Levybacteria bacterium CG_4_10_14_0_8_um_filter_35_23]PIZ99088.1 MAG: hypothetical protein COX78_02280 [Candidatus Levybacteria bacterium CG_4_10_14_0_2_um_filter_35_8]PJA91014.1 MAG: hypothetical protein CO135_03350 [Candidatus Levybacteria bacterium CG_4_9_14_3_um_filter_35_16]PJC54749.1 MAG: hypothetical protein CO028_00
MNNKISQNDNFIFSNTKQIFCKKGQIILRAEDNISDVYYIKNGYVREFFLSRDGRELTTSIFKPLDIFPLFWIVGKNSSEYNFETLTDVEMLRVSREKILEYLKHDPQFFLKLISRLINRLDAFNERIKYMVFKNASVKVASILLLLSERFGVKRKGEIYIQIPLAHKDIASLIGIARETASLEMKKFEKKGIYISLKHHILIKKMRLLKKATIMD